MNTLKTVIITLSLFLLLLCGAQAQNPVEGPDRLPWQTMTHQYCTVKRHYTSPISYNDTPLPGKQVHVVTTMRAGTDVHTHQLTDATARPEGTYRTPIVATTVLNAAGTEACVDFDYRNAGFSGIIDTTMETVDGSGPVVSWFNRLKVPDRDYFGNAYPLSKMTPGPYVGSLTQPYDSRHLNEAGVGGNSFYGRANSVHMMKVMMYNFALHKGNAIHYVPRLSRGVLPNGGYADNEVGYAQNGPFFGPWVVGIPQETHQYGFEWDIDNPILWMAGVGYTSAQQLDAWLVFKAAVIASGAQFGKLNPSTGYPMTDAEDQSNQWLTRDKIHINALFVAKN